MNRPLKVRVSLDPNVFGRKPSGDEFGKISNRLSRYAVEIGMDELAVKVTKPLGRTWSGGTFTWGKPRNNETWMSQQVFALDFDGGISFTEVKQRCEEYGLDINFAYATFSSLHDERFRVVFVVPTEVRDVPLHRLIQTALLKIFPEADQSCRDVARLIAGGKDLIYQEPEAVLNIEKLIDSTCIHIMTVSGSNASRNLSSFCREVGINMVNGLPFMKFVDDQSVRTDYPCDEGPTQMDEVRRNHVITYNNMIGLDMNSSSTLVFSFASPSLSTNPLDGAGEFVVHKDFEKRQLIRMVNWEGLYERCLLYKGFMDGKILLNHYQLFGLATNFLWLMGGRTRFFQGLAKRQEYNVQKWEKQWNYIDKRNYKPKGYAHFYSEAEEEAQAINLVQAAKLHTGRIHVYEPLIYKTLPEAEAEFENVVNGIMDKDDDRIYVVRADTGLGKTEWYLSLRGACVAVCTHKLKDEVVARFRAKGINAMASPGLPGGLHPETAALLDRLYRVGAHKKASVYLWNIRETDEDIENYFEQLEAIGRCGKDDVVVTTHERLLYLDVRQDTIIIDEDILGTLLKQGSMEVEDLRRFVRSISEDDTFSMDHDCIEELYDLVSLAGDNVLYDMPHISIDMSLRVESLVVKKEIRSNVLGFLSATNFLKSHGTVTYITRRELPVEKKIIILSASVNEKIYTKLFGNRLGGFYDVGRVVSVGKVVQYPQRSFSRHSLQENIDLINIGRNLAGNSPVITFKNAMHHFENPVASFGATSGLDAYAGQDLVIFGTPHLHPTVYMLYGRALGMKADNTTMSYSQVRRNGYEFWFQTYSDPDLQELQFHMIEAELVQAVGRARVLRNNCTVTVLSSYPIPGAEFVYLDREERNRLMIDPTPRNRLTESGTMVAEMILAKAGADLKSGSGQ